MISGILYAGIPDFRGRIKTALGVAVLLSVCAGLVAAEERTSRWEAAIRAFEEADREHPPQPGQVLFIGSSSIRLWKLDKSFPGLDALNRGFGGSQVSDSVRYFDRIVKPYRPRTIVLYAGDNDLNGGKSPERVADDVAEFVRLTHEALPETRVLFLSIKPSIRRWAMIDRVRAANSLIRKRAEQDPLLEFIDVEPTTLDEAGQPRKELFVADGLHLSAKGYEQWSQLLRPHLATAAQDSP